jgi:TPR repeat protein
MRLNKLLIPLAIAFPMLFVSGVVVASSLDEGKTALNNGDYATAVELLLPLSVQGNGDAQYQLGYMYATGKGVQRSQQKELEWYERAAESGYVAAFSATGRAYDALASESSINGPTQESEAYYKQAFKWYSKAADAGYASGFSGLASLYRGGHGVKRNKPLGIAYYTEAAKLGHLASQFILATILASDYQSSGNIVDLEQAYKWFKIHAFYDTENANTYSNDSYIRAKRYRVYKQLSQNQVYKITFEAIGCVESKFKNC